MSNYDKLHILVIEDNEGDWFLIKEYLKESFNESYIDNIKTLGEATISLLQIKYDIIFLDLTLPDSNGNECVEKVVSLATDTPVIVLTGYENKEFAKRTLNSGIQDYILKDEVTSALLLRTIDYSIERNKVKLKLKSEQKKKEIDISEAIISAQEKERFEISIELHDNINQLLTGSRMFLKMVSKNKDKAETYLHEADELLRSAINEIRTLSHTLAPPDLKGATFDEVLSQLIEKTSKSCNLNITSVWSKEDLNNLSKKLSLNLFRIIQEQLTNILKYANAQNIIVKIVRDNQQIALTIKDDGIGFDTSKKVVGVGLTNIRTRASLFNGSSEIISSPSNGCILQVQLKVA